MIIKEIELKNFRNYSDLKVEFNKGINFIVGENAKGKTNLVEAIYTLSSANSFRTLDATEMIKFKEKSAYVKCKLDIKNSTKIIEITYVPQGKKIKINNTSVKKVSELSSVVKVCLFSPKDTQLLKEAPKLRRNYVNSMISKLSTTYLNALITYEKILKERNDAFKAFNVNKTLIDILRDRLIELNRTIFKERRMFFEKINETLANIYPRISLHNQKMAVKYLPMLNYDTKEEYMERLEQDFYANEEEEYRKKTTLFGVHKEDFEVYIDGRDVAKFGSQGENRMCVLALKIAPYYLVSDLDNRGIVILDDVLSELDEIHEENLIRYLETLNQVFITNTNVSKFYEGEYYRVVGDNLKKEVTE